MKKMLCTAACMAALAAIPAVGSFPLSVNAFADTQASFTDPASGQWEETGDPLCYRFRDTAGNVTEYSLVPRSDTFGDYLTLYINGEPAKRADIPVQSD